MLIDLDLLDIFCKLNGPCCGLSKSLGLEHDNGDDGLFVPINVKRVGRRLWTKKLISIFGCAS